MVNKKQKLKKQNQPLLCKIDISSIPISECKSNFRIPTHSFKNGKYYRDEMYFGDVIYADEKMIQVQCKNGKIITMEIDVS